MGWTNLESEDLLEQIHRSSFEKPQLIFKHSTRCSISTVIKNRLFRSDVQSNMDYYYLDLIAYRNISNKIAERYGVAHESPQVLLIKEGKCVYHESHNAIYMEEIVEHTI